MAGMVGDPPYAFKLGMVTRDLMSMILFMFVLRGGLVLSMSNSHGPVSHYSIATSKSVSVFGLIMSSVSCLSLAILKTTLFYLPNVLIKFILCVRYSPRNFGCKFWNFDILTGSS